MYKVFTEMLLIAVSYVQAMWEELAGQVVHRDQLIILLIRPVSTLYRATTRT